MSASRASVIVRPMRAFSTLGLVGLAWLVVCLADCSGRDYGYLFVDAGECADASADGGC